MRSATILLEQPLFFFSFVFATFVYSAIRMISPVRERETIPCRVKNTDERIALDDRERNAGSSDDQG